MSPINPSQSAQPSLSSYFPQLASAFANAVQPNSTDRICEAAGAVMQIDYGLINIPVVGSHNEITVHYHSTASDAQLLREILRPLQSMVLQSNAAPLASLGIQRLQKSYLDGLQKDEEIKDALAMYVAPECTLITNVKECFSLEEKVRDFLASKEKKVLLLLGVAGSGKSTFNRYLARSLWEAYDKEANKSGQTPIPLFIRLSNLKDPNTNLISEYLKKEKFTEEQVAELKENYRFIFILDGYDEIKDRTRLFYVENELDEWQAKVIVTSRPEYLGDRYERQFHPKGQAYLLQTYQLAPFSDVTIEEYVNKYKSSYPELEKSVAEHGEILERSEVKELMRNPFLLKLALGELPALAERYKNSSQRITRLALYDQFVESWFERSQDRLSGIRLTDAEQKAFHFLNKAFIKHGTKFSKDLAIEMYQAGLVRVAYSEQLSYDESSAVAQDWRDKFLSESNEKIKLLRFNAPLICRDDQYEFIHKSIPDYLVARALWEEFEVREEIELTSWLNRLNIVNDPAILQFLAERVWQEPKLKNCLLSVVDQSKGEGGAQLERGAANAITILVRAGVPFTKVDLKGIRIPGANLSYGVFDSAQLQKADLTGVKLDKSWLRQANLSGAQMAGVQFGEWPYLQEEDPVLSCAYSPDGGGFATGLENGKIGVYQTSNWEKIHTLIGHTAEVFGIAYNPKGNQLASSSEDETVRLWDVKMGSTLHILSFHAGWGAVLAYNPQGDQLVSGGFEDRVLLWDAKTGIELQTLIGHETTIFSVAYNLTGDQLASGSSDMTVRLWDVKTGTGLHILRGHEQMVMSLAYSPQGDQIVSCDDKGIVFLWDVKTGARLYTLDGDTEGVHRVVYSLQGDLWLVSGSVDGTVRLWDVKAGACLNTFSGHMGMLVSLAYSPIGDQLASGGGDATVRLWDAKMVSEPNAFGGHEDIVRSVVYLPQGDQLASCSLDNTVRLWDVKTGAELKTLIDYKTAILDIAYHPKSDQFALSSSDSIVSLRDAKTGAELKAFSGHTGSVYSIAYSPQGDQLASCGEDGTVRLWDVKMGTELKVFSGHAGDVDKVAYSPQGDQLASCGKDGTVRLWDIKTGTELHILSRHTEDEYVLSVAYSPKGDSLASCGEDKTIRLWDSKTGAEHYTLIGHTNTVLSVAYSPKGDLLASGGFDTTVRLWEVETGECQRVIQDCSMVISLDWKEILDGQYLAMGGIDKSVRQWKIKKEGGEYKETFCWSTGHDFLTVGGALIEGVKGLNEVNERLLKQRGAVQTQITSKSSNSGKLFQNQLGN